MHSSPKYLYWAFDSKVWGNMELEICWTLDVDLESCVCCVGQTHKDLRLTICLYHHRIIIASDICPTQPKYWGSNAVYEWAISIVLCIIWAMYHPHLTWVLMAFFNLIFTVQPFPPFRLTLIFPPTGFVCLISTYFVYLSFFTSIRIYVYWYFPLDGF